MESIETLLALTETEDVKVSQALSELMNKKLCFGATDHMIENGVHGEGHETLTPAHKYLRSISESWTLSNSIILNRGILLQLEGRKLGAEHLMARSKRWWLKWLSPKKAKSLEYHAKSELLIVENAMVQKKAELLDLNRQLRKHNEIRERLEPWYDATYPNGIEQSEPDIWKDRMRYRLIKGKKEDGFENICLSPLDKALLGVEYGRLDAAAWLLTTEHQDVMQITQGNASAYLKLRLRHEQAKRELAHTQEEREKENTHGNGSITGSGLSSPSHAG